MKILFLDRVRSSVEKAMCIICWRNLLLSAFTILTIKGDESYQDPRHYVLNLTQTSQQDAWEICAQNGGYLATIYDYSTIPDLELSDFLKETDEALVWIGQFKTNNGTLMWDGGDGITYQNWEAGVSSDYDCVAATFREPYTWTYKPCSLRLPYLCQYEGGQCRFKVYNESSIAAHNYMYLYEKTPEECQEVCITNEVFLCQSFEYNTLDRRCQFNSGNKWTLAQFYSSHQGWDYYHRTCNSGEVTGTLLDLTSSIMSTTSLILYPSSTLSSSVFSPAFTSTPETSTFEIQCSEMFITKDIFITHDVYQTREVVVSKDVFVTRDLPITRDVVITNDVTMSTTVTETETEVMTVTETITLTPSPIFYFPSDSIYQDPVEELMELETEIKQKAKTLKKISVKDDRPSATYVGYIAILFLSIVFGSILLFDLLTIFQSGMCKKCTKTCHDKSCKTVYSVRKASIHKIGIEADSKITNEPRDNTNEKKCDNGMHSGETNIHRRLWRRSQWAVDDSGFGGSGSEISNCENDGYEPNTNNNANIVTIEIQNPSPSSSDYTFSSTISVEQNLPTEEVCDEKDADESEDYNSLDLDIEATNKTVNECEERTTYF